jgi:hypothetical protein
MCDFVKAIKLVVPEEACAVACVFLSHMISVTPGDKENWLDLVNAVDGFVRQTISIWNVRMEIPNCICDLNSDLRSAFGYLKFTDRCSAGTLVACDSPDLPAGMSSTKRWDHDGTCYGFHYRLESQGQRVMMAVAIYNGGTISTLVIQSKSCLGSVWCHTREGMEHFTVHEDSTEADGIAYASRILSVFAPGDELGKRKSR